MNLSEIAIKVLNEAFAVDPAAITALFENRIPCNVAMIDHPTIPVYPVSIQGDHVCVGTLGVINGILTAAGAPLICTEWTSAEPYQPGQASRLLMTGFRLASFPPVEGKPLGDQPVLAGSKPQVVCILKHLIDEDDDGTKRWVEENEICELLATAARPDGVHYQVGVPSNGAVGWYEERDFHANFKPAYPKT